MKLTTFLLWLLGIAAVMASVGVGYTAFVAASNGFSPIVCALGLALAAALFAAGLVTLGEALD